MLGFFNRLHKFFTPPTAPRRRATTTVAADAATAATASAAPLPPPPEVVAPVAAVNRPALPPGTVKQLDTLILRTIETMPPLPQQAVRILRELNSDTSSARSVAELAGQDPVLAATILRTANSAAYALPTAIVGVQEAIAHLGFSAVRSLMMRLKLSSQNADGAAGPALEELWTHGMAVSQIAEVLATKYGADRQLCSTLGLLHDLGKLVILRAPAEIVGRLGEPGPAGEGNLARERRVLGADHADIGAYVAGLWQLPPDIVEGIRYHHSPHLMPDTHSADFRKTVATVFVANQVSKFLHPYSDDAEINAIPDEVRTLLHIDAATTFEDLVTDQVRDAVTGTLLLAEVALGKPANGAGRVIRLTTNATRNAVLEAAVASTAELRITAAEASSTTLFFTAVAGEAAVFHFSGAADTAPTIRDMDELMVKLNAKDELRGRIKLTVRWLVESVRRIDAAAGVDVAVALQDGHVVACVQCEALKFDKRFGSHVHPMVSAKVLDREFAGVLNLGWFEQITCSEDGGALLMAA